MAKVLGRTALQKKLRLMPDHIVPPLREAVGGAAGEVVDLQKRLVVEKSGELRDSIVWRYGDQARIAYSTLKSGGKTGSDPRTSAVISAGNADVRYAHLVEFGTAPHIVGGIFAGAQHPGTAPKPFFFPAYRAKKRAARARIARAMTKALREVAKS